MENYSMLFTYPSSLTSVVGNSEHGFSGMNGQSSNSIGLDQKLLRREEVHRDGILSHQISGRRISVSDELGDSGNNNNNNNKKKGEKKVKKGRYAFQTRSQVDILDDGYKWRKYGQKAVKNNKFPRSYYRCTHQECNVKKQIQRLTKDEGVVMTTYEGIHTHPIEKKTDNFEHILTQMQIYTPLPF
ncbi:PREDICTED: probable WRKY transcription factor 75 [Lupinus angustifolius]|nr:PREDICTED: probable WRKY transcription factor 75 [Lupinus angustifolius]